MRLTVRIAFWGDHRGLAQYQAHDKIEQARWRARVATNEAKRARQAQPCGWLPAFLRRQAD